LPKHHPSFAQTILSGSRIVDQSSKIVYKLLTIEKGKINH